MKDDLKQYLKQKVVLDTNSSFIYIGVLDEVREYTAVLTDVDVHDNRDTGSTKDLYVHGSKVSGGQPNREKVYVNLDYVISFSLLDEVMRF